MRSPYRVLADVRRFDEHSFSQQRMFNGPIMKSAELRAMPARLDVLRDIMVELVAALPSDRAVDERTDDAMVSDLAPVFAALRQIPINTQDYWRDMHQAVR